MDIKTRNNKLISMGDNCAHATVCAYLKDTALAVVSFFAYYFRFIYTYYFPFALSRCRAKLS